MDKVDTIQQQLSGKSMRLPPRKRLRMEDYYRSQHNPLRGLTMSMAVRLLEDGNRGAYADLQWLYRFAERSYEPLKACKGKMQDAIVKLDWNIKTPDDLPDSLKATADRQRDTLRAEYDQIVNIRHALKFLVTGFFRGFAHLEKHWAKDAKGNWHVVKLEPVSQWHWVRDGMYSDWQFNPRSQSGLYEGEPVDLSNFIHFEIDDPIDYPGLIRFIRANTAEKDWSAWLERFGVPHIYAVAPESANDDDKLSEFVDYVDAIMSDSGGALPAGTELETLSVHGTGADTFEKALSHHEEMVVLAATNSKLTMLAESGSGTLAGGAHQNTWDDVAEARAMDISEVLQTHFDRPTLARLHPGEPPLAYFELAKEDEKDAQAVVLFAKTAEEANLETDVEELAEKSGYKLERKADETENDDELPGKRKPGQKPGDEDPEKSLKDAKAANRATEPDHVDDLRFNQAAFEHLASALQDDFADVRQRIQELIDAGDSEEAKRLVDALMADQAELFETVRANGNAETALQDILASSAANGVTDTVQRGLISAISNRFAHWLKDKLYPNGSDRRES